MLMMTLKHGRLSFISGISPSSSFFFRLSSNCSGGAGDISHYEFLIHVLGEINGRILQMKRVLKRHVPCIFLSIHVDSLTLQLCPKGTLAWTQETGTA